MFNFKIDFSEIFLLATRYKNQILLALFLILVILISIIIFFHFQTKKKALISGEIAVGFAYLEEGKKDMALIFFEKAFNKSEAFYKVISGIGVTKSLSDEEKILTVLSLIKNQTKNTTINNLINATLIVNRSAFKKEDLNEEDFKKFEAFAKKSNILLFKEALLIIYLNLNQKQKFEAEIKVINPEANIKLEDDRKFNLKERSYLLQSM